MRVELLLVSECPHADAARTVVAQALTELGLDVAVIERVGEYPSPTVLVDGVDVMTGAAGAAAVAACRLDVPTVAQMLRALQGALSWDSSDGYPAELVVGVTSSRIGQVSAPARALHKVILTGFAATGHAPEPGELAAAAPGGHDLGALLAELHDHDVIRLGEHGRIRAAYPFSGVRTSHVVAIDGGPAVYAMCAIDALGMSAMLGRGVSITSRDPGSGQDIFVTVHDGQTVWEPPTTVVFVGSDNTADAGCCPPQDGAGVVAAADRCCNVMNFFSSPATAHTWMSEHTAVQGHVLSKDQALRLGVDIFGRLLRD